MKYDRFILHGLKVMAKVKVFVHAHRPTPTQLGSNDICPGSLN